MARPPAARSEMVDGRTEHPHAELARSMWDAAARGDADALLDVYAPDVFWKTYGPEPVGREVRGADEALAYLVFAADSVDDMRVDVLSVYASDDGAALRYHVEAERGEHRLDTDFVMLLEIAGRRIVRVDVVPFDAAGAAAFWRSAR